jgi:hypothetical protein
LEREIKNAFDDVNARMVEIFFSKNEAHAIVLVLKDGRVLNMTKTRNRFLRLLYYVFIWDDHIIYIYNRERYAQQMSTLFYTPTPSSKSYISSLLLILILLRWNEANWCNCFVSYFKCCPIITFSEDLQQYSCQVGRPW